MKILFVFVFTGFQGGGKTLPKLGFAAFISSVLLCQSIVPFGCIEHVGVKLLEGRRVVRFCAPSTWKDEFPVESQCESQHEMPDSWDAQILVSSTINPSQLEFAGLETMSSVHLIPVFHMHSVQTGGLHEFSHLDRYELFPRQANPIQRLS